MLVKATGGMSLAEGSFCALGPDPGDGIPVRTTGGWRRVAIAVAKTHQSLNHREIAFDLHEPLLPASAIESLPCVAVSKTPPMDVIELAVEP